MTALPTPPPAAGDRIDGVVDHLVHVTYDHHTVLRLTVADDTPDPQTVTAVGKALFGTQPGESLRLTGTWTRHPRYGRQFKAEVCERTWPATRRAMRLYLASGLIHGIGETLATAIVDRFGDQTLHIIDTEPQRLLEVHGIGPTRLERITQAWHTQKAIAEIMVFLQGLGLSAHLAIKIYQTYTDDDRNPMDAVRHTPYQLCRDIHGIGFETADRIALAVGIPKHSDQRLQAALLHTLTQARARGDCHLPERVLLARTRHLLTDDDPTMADILEDPILRQALEALRARGEAVIESLPVPVLEDADVFRAVTAVSLTFMYRAETGLAQDIQRLHHAPPTLAEHTDWTGLLAQTAPKDLTDEQQQAVLTALTTPVSILTGGPGCGKTHTLRTLVTLAEQAGLTIALAAPTGKAAKRMEETTGHPATTVHRLISSPPAPTDRSDEPTKLEAADLIVIDEASMLDVQLAARLTAAIRTGCHLLMVGDTDQLPSVGPGRVLHDILTVPDIPRTHLTHIFRQDDQSAAIIDNAHRILRGLPPLPAPGVFGCHPLENPDTIAEHVVELVTTHIPHHFNAAPDDIQVLCPARRHATGTLALNARLQARLNPPAPDKPQHYHEGHIFRLGDRVLQIRNQPHRGKNGVFNGSTGTITAIDPEIHQLTVTLTDGEPIPYLFADLDELLHAYALTVHRSQGSEYPYVVIPMTTSAGQLLQRNLLYTAVTRASRGAVLTGQATAVHRALTNTHTRRRFTALEHRIRQQTAATLQPRVIHAAGQLALS
ncbi:ATP-dependent RecD-like DNA helicase [Streptomyces sp. 4503]|uniref:ATP-dependent RecD2 DNA helicase n=1 Tax=Streptomyces niphimycinicus TaxID=2842201 RepID=A0ABS6CH44_9ACTN|nr:ATP-dependent RecD-like DNA helicase [Streptomyces niphimycinicus]MBU3866247.1 ATP-dependent RecD-like DNA helicase [Streptomyces niphimycinicus]